MPEKLKTGLMVTFLSCLIWVFAERQVTQTEIMTLPVNLDTSRPEFWVEFLDERNVPLTGTGSILRLTVQASAGRILKIEQGHFDQPVLLDVTKLNLPLPNPETIDPQRFQVHVVEDLLKGELRFDQLYLKVTESEPVVLSLQVSRLHLAALQIKVQDLDGNALTVESMDPAQVQAYLAPAQLRETIILLTPDQIARATRNPLALACPVPNPARKDPTENYRVNIKLAEQRIRWDSENIQNPRLGYLWPATMKENMYEVVLEDSSFLEESIEFRATPAAALTYRGQRYHLELEIHEEDPPNQIIPRQASYRTPENPAEIEITRRTIPIQFQLVPRLKDIPP